MEERCELCKHYYKLEHNFRQYKGFEKGYCCTVFYPDPGGWILEVEPNGMCEMFEEENNSGIIDIDRIKPV